MKQISLHLILGVRGVGPREIKNKNGSGKKNKDKKI